MQTEPPFSGPLPPGVEILPPGSPASGHHEIPEPAEPRWPGFEIALWAVLMLLYIVSPIDFIPDFIPLLGQFDDLLIGGGFLGLIARAVLRFHRLRALYRMARKPKPAAGRGLLRSIFGSRKQ